MTTLSQLALAMQNLFTTHADLLARRTGCIQRQVKFSGASFAQTLVFGWLANPNATLESFAQAAAAIGLSVSPQAIAARFTAKAADFLQALLANCLQQVIVSDPVAIDLLQRFRAVYLQDSTTLALPAALAARFPGSGNGSKKTTAALKLHLRLDYLRGQLAALLISPARQADVNSGLHELAVEAGQLRLADLGYWDLHDFAQIHRQGGYFLSRLKLSAVIWVDGDRLELSRFLRNCNQDHLDLAVALGGEKLVRARLVAERLPAAVAAVRRRKRRATAKRKGRTVKSSHMVLAGWNLYVTNAEVEKLKAAEVLVLGRARWQVELIFKLWKQYGQLDKTRSGQAWRPLCEIYAKLLGLIVAHWGLVVSVWRYADKSLVKGLATIRSQAMGLAVAIGSLEQLIGVLAVIVRSLQGGCRINKRQRQPHTFQLLQEPGRNRVQVGTNHLLEKVAA